MAKSNLAVEIPQGNLTNPTFDRVFSELGFSSQFPFAFERHVIESEPEEHDDNRDDMRSARR